MCLLQSDEIPLRRGNATPLEDRIALRGHKVARGRAGARPRAEARGRRIVLPEAVDDPAALKVIRGQLDLDAVAGVDPDAEAPHLPGGVAQRLVAVVECDAELAVAQRLDDLAFQLDLLFLRRNDESPLATRRSTRSPPGGLSRPPGTRTPPSPPPPAS